MVISICIPTYNRSALLKEAIESCLNQTLLPDEILVGDDSSNTETEYLVKEIAKASPIKIRYFKNFPAYKQAQNVNHLFSNSKSKLLMLLHDDDTLVTTALENLYSCFINNPDIDAAFGKQYIISNNGEVDTEASLSLNKDFFREQCYSGLKLSSIEAGFLQQFPNDCYLIRAAVAKTILYNEKIGDCCDFEFGLRLGLNNYKLYFLNEYTAHYRKTDVGISKKIGNDAAITSFKLVEALQVPMDSLELKNMWLKNKAPIALVEAARLKRTKDALAIFKSTWYREERFTLAGAKRLLIIIKSIILFLSYLIIFRH